MNVVQFPIFDRKRESQYLQPTEGKMRLIVVREQTIECLERTIALLTSQSRTIERLEACRVMRGVVAELKALDPSGLDDDALSTVVNDRLKSLRAELSKSCFDVSGSWPTAG